MRTKIFNFLVLLSLLFSFPLLGAVKSVTLEEALYACKLHFQDKDVDYYHVKNINNDSWTIFVDADPMAGWEHECYKIDIPTTIEAKQQLYPLEGLLDITRMKRPPVGNVVPLEVKNRYGSNSTLKPIVRKTTNTNSDNSEIGKRTYALIISGGMSQISNHIRYWNDCSFIYQTLVNKYDVPKANIYPIMSDGTNPAVDVNLGGGQFASQDLDLDGDGEDDIQLAATRTNIRNTLNTLQSKLKEDDHLFIYVIDHGGSNDKVTRSYINLWGVQTLQDYELAEWLVPFCDKYVNVNVVLGPCYSGGFIDDLTRVGCVVSAACSGSENSYGCSDIPFDEFVYHWTCAVNGAKHNGTPVSADANKNGKVTMQEAFAYAKANDRISKETPQYVSTPISVGDDLAFNYLAPATDIYIMDNDEDTGIEPNTTTELYWKSPDICVRNQDDSIFEHENPIYSDSHQFAYIYVKVHNRGKKKYTGGKFLHVYWAQASTGLTDKAWRGREVYVNEDTGDRFATGAQLQVRHIDTIPAGSSRILKIRWDLPYSLESEPDGYFHYCIAAKILNTVYDDDYIPGQDTFEVLKYKTIAQKNVSIIKKTEHDKPVYVYVRNTSSESKKYTLELIPRTEADKGLYSRAKVDMVMSPKVYSAWERGGCQSQYIERPDRPAAISSNNSNAAATSQRTVRFISPQSQLNSIALNGDEFDVISLRFKFLFISKNPRVYEYDLIQRDEDGNVVGGETFIIEEPNSLPSGPITISSSPAEGGQFNLGVEGDTENFSSYEWRDAKGESIGCGSSVTVRPSAGNDEYAVSVYTNDGDIACGSISLESEYGIKSVSTTSGFIDIQFASTTPQNASVSLVSVQEGAAHKTVSVDSGVDNMTIDISDLVPGAYVLSYYIDGKLIDSCKVNN